MKSALEWLSYMWREYWLALLVVAAIPLLIVLAVMDAKNWDEFSREHHCRRTREISGSTSVGYVSTGQTGGVVSTYDPGKTCYLCDDGVEYCR